MGRSGRGRSSSRQLTRPTSSDADGNQLIDYVMGLGPMLLGHSPVRVVDAVKKQLDKGILYGGSATLEREAAERVIDMVPCAERVRFTVTGTEAIQAALRIARHATGRKKILKFQGHYHGWLDNVSWNVSRSAEADGSGVIGPVAESMGIQDAVATDLVVVEWNDLTALESALQTWGSQIAAVVMEPIMAMSSGVILPDDGYLERVSQLCAQFGCLLLFDEIVTGFRVAPGGAQQLFGVTPDLAVFGKAIASGLPVSCVAGREGLFDGIASGLVIQGGTFAGNPVGMAAVVATLSALGDRSVDVYGRLEQIGNPAVRRLDAYLCRIITVRAHPGPTLSMCDLLHGSGKDPRFEGCTRRHRFGLVAGACCSPSCPPG